MAKLIPDISHWDTVTDWRAFCASAAFAMVKATQGTDLIDPAYGESARQLRAFGVPYYPYAFLTARDGAAQARWLLAVAGDGAAGMMVDAEPYAGSEPTRAQVRDAVRYLVKRGHRTILYYGNNRASKYSGIAAEVDPGMCVEMVARYGATPPAYDGYALWQYTETGSMPGVRGGCDLSRLSGLVPLSWFTGKGEAKMAERVSRANIAATNMEHICKHSWHGYSQPHRDGDGEGTCKVVCEGHTSHMHQGDYDCSSAVIECWQQALAGTGYARSLDGATYTGNMRKAFVKSGLFEWKPMSFTAQRGDIYLREGRHTAMCTSAVPDMLGEFSVSERGTTDGRTGDQTGRESRVRPYYDYPWDGILHYNGKADTAKKKAAKKTAAKATAAKKDTAKKDTARKTVAKTRKTVAQLADEVEAGKWGNYPERKQRLEAAGYDYTAVRAEVNRRHA